MCGRYFIDGEMWREIKKICKQIDDSNGCGVDGNGGGAPGTHVLGLYE